MNGKQALHGFDLDEQASLDDQVQPIPAAETDAFIVEWHLLLSNEPNAPQ
jgi:hypothetical protein